MNLKSIQKAFYGYGNGYVKVWRIGCFERSIIWLSWGWHHIKSNWLSIPYGRKVTSRSLLCSNKLDFSYDKPTIKWLTMTNTDGAVLFILPLWVYLRLANGLNKPRPYHSVYIIQLHLWCDCHWAVLKQLLCFRNCAWISTDCHSAFVHGTAWKISQYNT